MAAPSDDNAADGNLDNRNTGIIKVSYTRTPISVRMGYEGVFEECAGFGGKWYGNCGGAEAEAYGNGSGVDAEEGIEMPAVQKRKAVWKRQRCRSGRGYGNAGRPAGMEWKGRERRR